MLGPDRPPFEAFKANWTGTVRIGVIQLEEISPDRFFFEMERIAWHQNSWTVSYYIGEITVHHDNGRYVSKFEHCTEPLVVHNIGGHQGAQHSVLAMVRLDDRSPARDRAWDVKQVRYERRTAAVDLSHRETGQQMTLRFARIVEGTWVLLTR